MKKFLLPIFLIHTFISSFSQESNLDLKRLLDFVSDTRDYQEGFLKNVGTNEFRYHSIRTDITECLLTRASDGTMAIEWETSPIAEKMEKEGVGFIWIAALDITSEVTSFNVYLNDKKRFTIKSGQGDQWKLKNEGGELSFLGIEKDQHGDSHGYMALWAPGDWLIPGKSQIIKIEGEPAGTTTWVIVYMATDAADYLQQSIQYDMWLTLNAVKKRNNYEVNISAPIYFTGEKLMFSSPVSSGSFNLDGNDHMAVGSFLLPVTNAGKSLEIQDSRGVILATEFFGEAGSTTKLLTNAIIKINQISENGENIKIEAQRKYNPKTVKSLLKLSESKLTGGNIYLMNSSHQDIAWMDSPEKCELERDTMLLSPLFELATRDPNYRFDVEDALMLKEFIRRHPDQKSLVKQMLSDGRISCGATYIQPYEEMYSGESLVRQFYFGAKWLKDVFDYQANVYWNVDIPGRTLQMPQIMKKAGTEYLMMSRFEKGFYRWYSPDGSFITAFSPGHYADAFTPLQKDFYEAAQYISSSALYWEKYIDQKSDEAVIPLLSDWDMSPAVDYSHIINEWEGIKELQNDNNMTVPVALPSFRIANGPEFFNAVTKNSKNVPSIEGERPAVWLYIHGPSHQKALKVSREGDIILTQAEKFATANARIDNSFKNYPENELNAAWEAKIYPDHGWGGKNGMITDNLFYQKFLFARNEGEKILKRTLHDISSKIKTFPNKGIPIIIFNSLSWNRTDAVSVNLTFDQGETQGVSIKDGDGNNIDIQLSDIITYDDGSLKSANVHFIAEEIPSIGYKTFYYKPAQIVKHSESGFNSDFENKYYRISFGNGGLKSIYDKELQQELIDNTKFKAGEIFTMQSVGNGAGEFADVQQPDMEGFDKTGLYQTFWEVVDQGPVFSSFKMRGPIRHAVVEQTIIIYNHLKRIDFQTDILNWEGILYREFRFVIPLNMSDGQVVYEVPYGVLEVGKDEMSGSAGERYIYPCKETRPRGIQNWIGAYNKDVSVILSSSVAVADFADPTEDPVPHQVLQPILLASRKSCHWEGNDYLQTGNHNFFFSLTSTRPDWKNGYKSALQANEKLQVVVDPRQYIEASLPESLSFYGLDASNVIISTIKKAENDNSTIIRLVEFEGENSDIKLKTFKIVTQVEHTNLLEEAKSTLSNTNGYTLPVGHHAIETYNLK